MFDRAESLQSALQMSKSDYLSLSDNLYNIKKLYRSNPLIIHQRTPEGQNVLHVAASTGNNELVRFLLDNGADINAKDREGMTPLHRAAYANKETTVKLLLERNALLLRNNKGETALHIANQQNCNNFDVRNLIGKRFPESVNMQDNDGNTALHLALKNGFDDGVDHLILNMQADDAIPNNEGVTPATLNEFIDDTYRKGRNRITFQLGIAARGELDKLKFLAEHDDSILKIKHTTLGLNLLHVAAFNGQQDFIRYLTIEKTFAISDMCTKDRTALLCALQNGKTASAKYLVNKRMFPLRDRDTSGRTPLLISVCGGNLDTVKYIVEKKQADLTEVSNIHNTALHYAAIYGHFPVFSYLLSLNKFKLDQTNKNGSTVLTLAADNGHFDIVKYLIDGTYVTLTDARYSGTYNILTVAIPHSDIFKFILERIDLMNCSSISAMETAIKTGKVLASIIDDEFERRMELTWQSAKSSDSEMQKSELVVTIDDLANLYAKIRPESAAAFLPEFYTRTDSPEKAFDMYSTILSKDSIKPEDREATSLSIAELFLTLRLLPKELAPDLDTDARFAAGISALPYILPYGSEIAQRMKNTAISFICGDNHVRDQSQAVVILPHIMAVIMKHLNPADHSVQVISGLWKLIQENLGYYSDNQLAQQAVPPSTSSLLTITPTFFSTPTSLITHDAPTTSNRLM